MAELGMELCGLRLRSPFIVSSGPLTYGAAAIRRALEQGAAGAVTKTIGRQPAVNPVPHIAALGQGSLLNTEKWSDLPPERWLEQELPALHGVEGLVIASVGHHPADVEALAAPLVAAGAGALEVVSYDAADMVSLVKAARARVAVPILAKLSPNWSDAMECAAACLAAGAGGLTAIDSLGPTLAIDVETGRPVLGGPGWLSGAAIKPLTVRFVAELCRRHPGVDVVATGGVSRAEDVVEMVMAGAAAVGVHTAPLLRGLGWLGKTRAALERWLDERGHPTLAGLRGVALAHLPGPALAAPLDFIYQPELCTGCGRCVTVCAYQARRLEGRAMSLDRELCRSCGLCVSVCVPGALAAA